MLRKKSIGNLSKRHRNARSGSRYPAKQLKAQQIKYGGGMTTKQRMLLFCFFILCWVPYLIVFFPGLNTGDTARQICMFFRLPTRVAGRDLTDGVNVIYSSHHPLVMTWVFGAFYKLGYVGLALYTCLQMCLAAGVFTGALARLKKIGVPKWSLVLSALWLGLNPNISVFVINMLSDAPFAFMSLLFTMMLTDVVYSKGMNPSGRCNDDAFTGGSVLWDWRFDCKLVLVMLLTALCKKQGMYIVVFMLLVFLLAYHREWVRWLVMLAAVVLLFKVGFEGVVYGRLNVVSSGPQEALSLPFQQTACYFRDYDGEISEEERTAVGNVLDADNIARLYNEDNADPVKNTYHGADGALGGYLKAWFKGLSNAPTLYITSALKFSDGYFMPTASDLPAGQHFQLTSVEDLLGRYPQMVEKYGVTEADYKSINLTSPKALEGARETVKNAIFALDRLPVIGNLLSMGLCFMATILLWLLLVVTKRWREALPWMVSLLGIAMCILSPLDGCARYALPVTVALPIMCTVVLKRSK